MKVLKNICLVSLNCQGVVDINESLEERSGADTAEKDNFEMWTGSA